MIKLLTVLTKQKLHSHNVLYLYPISIRRCVFHISDSKVAKPRICVSLLSIMILTYTSSVREKRKKKKRTCSTANLLEISCSTVVNFQGINSKTTRVNSNKPKEIWKIYVTRKYLLPGYILGVLTHTTAWDWLWGGNFFLNCMYIAWQRSDRAFWTLTMWF